MEVGLFLPSQTRCGICKEDFGEESCRIVKLACSHILHDTCISSSVQHCPSCFFPITDRTIKNYTKVYKQKLAEDFTIFFKELSKDVPLKFFGLADIANDDIVELIKDEQSDKILPFFQKVLRLFSQVGMRQDLQETFTQWINHEIENEPLKTIPDIIQDIDEFARNVEKNVFSKNLPSLNNIQNLYLKEIEDAFNRAFQSPRLQCMLVQKREQYQMMFKHKNIFKQWVSMRKMTQAQFALVEKYPEGLCYELISQNRVGIVIVTLFFLIFVQMSLSSLCK